MIGVLIQLLIVLLVLVIIFYIVKLAGASFGIPGTIIQIVGFILGLIFLLYCLSAFGVAGPVGIHWRCP